MGKIEAVAKMTIRKGKLDGFKRQAAKIISEAKKKDTKTLRYDWFISEDQTKCEVHEVYESSAALIEHVMHIRAVRDQLFEEFADDHAITIYGDPSPELVAMAKAHKSVDVRWFSFFKGLDS